MFMRIAVVNRGEPAVRLIRAVRELNEEHGYGIKVIALHTEAEQRTLFVRSADESVCLRDVESGSGPYLDHAELERALRVSRADAGWVGAPARRSRVRGGGGRGGFFSPPPPGRRHAAALRPDPGQVPGREDRRS